MERRRSGVRAQTAVQGRSAQGREDKAAKALARTRARSAITPLPTSLCCHLQLHKTNATWTIDTVLTRASLPTSSDSVVVATPRLLAAQHRALQLNRRARKVQRTAGQLSEDVVGDETFGLLTRTAPVEYLHHAVSMDWPHWPHRAPYREPTARSTIDLEQVS